MKVRDLRLAGASALLLCGLCSSSALRAEDKAQAATPDTSAGSATPDYRFEAGDTVEIKFFYNSELNDTVQIRPDGHISMPLIGDVLVAGKSTSELSTSLEARYKDILRNPAVNIQVRNYANRRIFVGGHVQRPGVIPLVGKQTAMSAILEAGGLRPSAKRGEVLLVRRDSQGQPVTIKLSTNTASRGNASAISFPLQPFDLVLVSESAISKANRSIDQYIRQMIPITLSGGFSYLFNARIVP